MKVFRLLPILLVATLLTATACSKKTMENQSTDNTEPPAAAEAEPEPEAVEPEPEPETASPEPVNPDELIATHIYFDFDSAVLQVDAQELLKVKAQWLKTHPGIANIRIEGHCDERGTEAYNLALGARRAEAVKAFMTDMGINSVRLDTLSYGEEKPANTAKNEAAWSMNRRASFVINQ